MGGDAVLKSISEGPRSQLDADPGVLPANRASAVKKDYELLKQCMLRKCWVGWFSTGAARTALESVFPQWLTAVNKGSFAVIFYHALCHPVIQDLSSAGIWKGKIKPVLITGLLLPC